MDDGQQQTDKGIEAGALQRGEDGEDQQAEQKDVRELREADAGERVGHMHAHVRAAAEQVAVVHDEEDGGEADGLAELLARSRLAAARAHLQR
jgi:hypothetical protein